MATKAKDSTEAPEIKPVAASATKSVTSTGVLSSGGTMITGKVVHGRKTKLTAKEQGQLARGEIDEAGDPTGKEAKKDKFAVGFGTRVSEPEETLYQGT